MFLKSSLLQISIAFSRGMLVKKGFAHRSIQQMEMSFFNCLLVLVKGFYRGTKNLARLYVGVCKANKIGRNGGHSSTFGDVPCSFHT